VAMLAGRLARDLPYNDGIFAAVELRCPEGTIVNARPPAPIAAAHMHVALNAATVALQCVQLAIAASPDAPSRDQLTGPGFESGLGNQVWAWTGADGNADAFMVLDGNWVGGSGGVGRDGLDLGRNLVGAGMEGMFTDIEILESWYPLLFTEKRARIGAEGAGEHRAGGGNQMTFEPHGIDQMSGTTFGMRRWLPIEGAAGGRPGACNEFLVHHDDGRVEPVDVNRSGILVREGERFQMRLASGGGFGDPLDRDLEAVARDVEEGRITREDADAIYGVVLVGGAVDVAASETRRAAIREARLDSARPPVIPASDEEAATGATDVEEVPLYVGVVQRGAVAYAAESGAPLAVAPAHWTDGCAVIEERRWPGGPPVVFRSYLDPRSGRSLYVEAVLEGEPRAFEISPRRWTAAVA
jgi:N-methylhydantoinase B